MTGKRNQTTEKLVGDLENLRSDMENADEISDDLFFFPKRRGVHGYWGTGQVSSRVLIMSAPNYQAAWRYTTQSPIFQYNTERPVITQPTLVTIKLISTNGDRSYSVSNESE